MASSGLSTYLKNKVLNAALNGVAAAYTGTATVYAALLTSHMTAGDGTGAVVVVDPLDLDLILNTGLDLSFGLNTGLDFDLGF